MKNIKLLIPLLIILIIFTLACTKAKKPESDSLIIVCFGDSLTYGTGAGKGQDYPSLLANKLGLDAINAGVPGNTTAQALARLEDDVLDHHPDMVLITIGGNDLKNGVPVNTAKQNIISIINKIKATGARVILGGIHPPVLDRGYPKMYNEVKDETGIILIPHILEGIMQNSNLMSDMIHPNSKGYELVADKFYEKIFEGL